MRISENVTQLRPSATLAVTALCNQMRSAGRDVLDLSAGEPDFRTPEFASMDGVSAIRQGYTHYTPVPGTDQLRTAIADYLTRTHGRTAPASGIVVSNGAKQALFNAFFTLFGPGDDVLLPVPYWTSYPEMLALARARTVFVPGAESSGHRVDVAALDAAITPATRGLILNSPANPTGATYSHGELEALMSWAAERQLWVISDEIYGRLCYSQDRAASVLDLAEELLERVVLVDGVSKTFAMTGWRIGFSYSSPALAARLSALQSQITSGASAPAQAAAAAVYRNEARVQDAVTAMVRVFRRRRQRAADLLRQVLPEAAFILPDGAFYIFLRVDAYYDDRRPGSVAFCSDLLEQTSVALVPGEAFGDDRYVRLSFAAPEAEILEGIRRMGQFLNVPATVSS